MKNEIPVLNALILYMSFENVVFCLELEAVETSK
jgi:hypothetical protein